MSANDPMLRDDGDRALGSFLGHLVLYEPNDRCDDRSSDAAAHRLTVDCDRASPCAICRIDRPAAMPREISSRSSSLSARAALRRGTGAMPPLRANTR
jgi:hypothetical protein